MTQVYQREGPGGKKLDYIAGETVIERLLEVVPNFSWDGRIVSTEDGRAVVEGRLTVMTDDGPKLGYGVGSAKMGADLDSSLKAANTEALKNAAKNGFGIGLELWNADYRKKLDISRRAAGGSEQALKQATFAIAKERLSVTTPTVAQVAKLFGVKTSEMSDPEVLRGILEREGIL